MALAIGVHRNDKIYVDDVPVEVVSLDGYEGAVIRVDGHNFEVTDQKAVEILPQVLVSCGRPSDRRVGKNDTLVQYALKEWKQRKKALRDGELTQEEYDNLPEVQLPIPLLPRLLFDAPRSINIARAELYERT